MKDSRLHRMLSLPRRLLDACLLWQKQAAGLASLHGHHVFAPGLGQSSIAIDAGAHLGEFSRAAVDRFGCLCYALEPVPELFARIPESPRLERFLLALGAAEGDVVLHLSDNPQANSVDESIARRFGGHGSIVARVASLESFLAGARLAHPDLLKLDIEGSEIAVFAGTGDETLRGIGQITVEFHDFLDGCRDGSAIRAVKRRLRRAGFVCVVLSRPSGDHSDTLFINRRLHRLGPLVRIHLFLMSRFTLEARRLLQRASGWLS